MPRKPRMTLEERRVKRAERKIAAEEAAAKLAAEFPDGDPNAVPIRKHVQKIEHSDPQFFPPRLRLAIEYYLDLWPRDRKRAAERANMDPIDFSMHLSSPGVIEYIRKQEATIDEAVAVARAQARALHAAFLDENLVTAVKISAAKGDTDALTLGYERIGLRRDKNFMSQQQASPQSRPQIYRVLEQTVTQTVTQREITAEHPSPELPAPQQLERANSVEILDY
jgi:hypothetical protein